MRGRHIAPGASHLLLALLVSEAAGGVLVVGPGPLHRGERRAVHGPLTGGVDVVAVERRGPSADAGGRQALAAAGVSLLGAEPEVGVGVMDAGGQWSHPNPLAEGEPGFEVGAVGAAGVGRPLGE